MNGWDAIAFASIGIVCTVGLYQACKDIFKPSNKRTLNFSANNSAATKEKSSLVLLPQKQKPQQEELTVQDNPDRNDSVLPRQGQLKLLKTHSR